MSIRHVILGFLDWKPCSGYELKKMLAESPTFHWSGNSNQVYGALLELEREGSVTGKVMQGGRYPSRKVYTITERGRGELRGWLLGEVELPEIRSPFEMRLHWAEELSPGELDAFMAAYERRLDEELMMRKEQARRRAAAANGAPEDSEPAAPYLGAPSAAHASARSAREALIWERIEEGRTAALEAELEWTRRLRKELSAL